MGNYGGIISVDRKFRFSKNLFSCKKYSIDLRPILKFKIKFLLKLFEFTSFTKLQNG